MFESPRGHNPANFNFAGQISLGTPRNKFAYLIIGLFGYLLKGGMPEWLGKSSLSLEKANKLKKQFKVEFPQDAIKRPQYWHVKKAGRLGAIARNKKYGNPGTKEGRIKGGRNSVITHKLLNTAFQQRKPISYPKKSRKWQNLLEFYLVTAVFLIQYTRD